MKFWPQEIAPPSEDDKVIEKVRKDIQALVHSHVGGPLGPATISKMQKDVEAYLKKVLPAEEHEHLDLHFETNESFGEITVHMNYKPEEKK